MVFPKLLKIHFKSSSSQPISFQHEYRERIEMADGLSITTFWLIPGRWHIIQEECGLSVDYFHPFFPLSRLLCSMYEMYSCRNLF